jgi:hypothetical protein
MSTTYLLRYRVLDEHRTACLRAFGAMTADDDAEDVGEGVRVLGRWSTVGDATGYCVCAADSAAALHRWLLHWLPMASIDVKPIVDDNQARAIVLGTRTPPYVVDYSHVGDAPGEGESLFAIEFAFQHGKRTEGYQAFAGLTAAEDKEDAGANRCLGRWHDLGTGTGFAVCASKSEADLYAWAYHWTSLCDCRVVPVLVDSEARANLKADLTYGDAASKPSSSKSSRSWFS